MKKPHIHSFKKETHDRPKSSANKRFKKDEIFIDCLPLEDEVQLDTEIRGFTSKQGTKAGLKETEEHRIVTLKVEPDISE